MRATLYPFTHSHIHTFIFSVNAAHMHSSHALIFYDTLHTETWHHNSHCDPPLDPSLLVVRALVVVLLLRLLRLLLFCFSSSVKRHRAEPEDKELWVVPLRAHGGAGGDRRAVSDLHLTSYTLTFTLPLYLLQLTATYTLCIWFIMVY